jgi:hypothetical protein
MGVTPVITVYFKDGQRVDVRTGTKAQHDEDQTRKDNLRFVVNDKDGHELARFLASELRGYTVSDD